MVEIIKNKENTKFRYLRKIFKIGDSYALTLPAIFIKANNLYAGVEMILECTETEIRIIPLKKEKEKEEENK